jgi:hypothetical protein
LWIKRLVAAARVAVAGGNGSAREDVAEPCTARLERLGLRQVVDAGVRVRAIRVDRDSVEAVGRSLGQLDAAAWPAAMARMIEVAVNRMFALFVWLSVFGFVIGWKRSGGNQGYWLLLEWATMVV